MWFSVITGLVLAYPAPITWLFFFFMPTWYPCNILTFLLLGWHLTFFPGWATNGYFPGWSMFTYFQVSLVPWNSNGSHRVCESERQPFMQGQPVTRALQHPEGEHGGVLNSSAELIKHSKAHIWKPQLTCHIFMGKIRVANIKSESEILLLLF